MSINNQPVLSDLTFEKTDGQEIVEKKRVHTRALLCTESKIMSYNNGINSNIAVFMVMDALCTDNMRT